MLSMLIAAAGVLIALAFPVLKKVCVPQALLAGRRPLEALRGPLPGRPRLSAGDPSDAGAPLRASLLWPGARAERQKMKKPCFPNRACVEGVSNHAFRSGSSLIRSFF